MANQRLLKLPLTRHRGSIADVTNNTDRVRLGSIFILLALVSCLCPIRCESANGQHHIRARRQSGFRQSPLRSLYEASDDSGQQSNSGGLEAELAAIQALQEGSKDESPQIVYEPNEPQVLGLDSSIISNDYASLARLLHRQPSPALSLSRQQPPIDYPQSAPDSWSSHRYTISGEGKPSGDAESLDSYGAKLAELLKNEHLLVNSQALLDSNSGDSFDEDNAIYSDIKIPSYAPIIDQRELAAGKQQQQHSAKNHFSTSGQSGTKSEETKPRSVKSSTLLDDEDLAKEDAVQGSTVEDTKVAEATTTSYGSLLEAESKKNETAGEASNSFNSVFNRLYNKLAGYLPFIDTILKAKDRDQVAAASSKEQSNETRTEKDPKLSPTAAKHEVSEPSGDTNRQAYGKAGNKSDDKSKKLSSSSYTLDSEKDENKEDERAAEIRINPSKANSARAYGYLKTTREPGDERYLSSLRKSSMSLPLVSEDKQLFDENDELLAKYIYAPEQHIHLNSGMAKKAFAAVDDDDDDEADEEPEQILANKKISVHRMRHFKPGDTIYGSIPYTTHASEVGLASNKSNDFYFLVMVAAFCMMAMAVVLTAGLFAYRIQQSRAATAADTDYPTYGVVGPNNMSAKSAGFIGGYFGGQVQSSASLGSGGSVKSAKLTINDAASISAISDNGATASTGGGSKSMIGKRASSTTEQVTTGGGNYLANQNAARMYHYQHQKQQMIISSDHASAGGRHTTSASDLDSEDENDDGSYTVYECPGLASAHEMEIKNPLFNDDRTP